jgi:hypothetical protein
MFREIYDFKKNLIIFGPPSYSGLRGLIQEPYLKSSGIQEPLDKVAFKMLFFSMC